MVHAIDHPANGWRILDFNGLVHSTQTQTRYGRTMIGFRANWAFYQGHFDFFAFSRHRALLRQIVNTQTTLGRDFRRRIHRL